MTAGALNGAGHAPADLSKDIRASMVYTLKKGCTFNDGSEQTATDVVEVGMQALVQGSRTPLTDYNKYFKHLEMRRTKPVEGEHTGEPESPQHFQSASPNIKTESNDNDSMVSGEDSAGSGLESEDSEVDVNDDVDALLATNPMFAVDIGEGDGDGAALLRRTGGDVALDMDVEEVEDLEEVENKSDGEVGEEEEDTDDDGDKVDDAAYRDL